MTFNALSSTEQTTLKVKQQALLLLGRWANAKLSHLTAPSSNAAIKKAKYLLNWTEDASIQSLRLLFDQIALKQGTHHQNYTTPKAISNQLPAIPYPTSVSSPDLTAYKAEVKGAIESLSIPNFNNLSLLSIFLEKYGSYLSFINNDVAFWDTVKATSAVASILAHDELDTEKFTLIAGDLSGIQEFIYTISADGALRSLRARSFYLELVTEEITQQLLEKLRLPRSCVIYVGGGNLYLLASAKEETQQIITNLQNEINQWLLETFQGKVYLTLAGCQFPTEDIANQSFANHWQNTVQRLAKQKEQKFANQIHQLLAVQNSYEPCQVCYRDDVQILKPLNPNEADSVSACHTCREMWQLGSQLFRMQGIARSRQKEFSNSVFYLPFAFPNETIYYHLIEQIPNLDDPETTLFLINNWSINDYQSSTPTIPLLLGNYGKLSESEEESGFMRAEEMTNIATEMGGIGRIGYLRMDVDNLGQIFAKGLGKLQTLPRIASLSRQMSYFFKVYLNSLAQNRDENLPEFSQQLTARSRNNLMFIYAGGDDLFISGVWQDVVEFAFDIYQSFRGYTGNHPEITLSGGIHLAETKFPLYKAAEYSGNAEESAKNNGRNSLSLFNEPLKWEEWLGRQDITISQLLSLDQETKNYLGQDIYLPLFGILPFVKIINDAEFGYPRSFVQNLLVTAKLQKQKLEEYKQIDSRDVYYYLHLPKIAYTLARVPKSMKENTHFSAISSSLKKPCNAPYYKAIATWLDLLNRSSQ